MGITENPFIIFSSNIFAILGLRSLYTVLSKAASDFKYLEPAVAIVLGVIGTKMFAEFFGIYVPTILSLGIVITMISSGCLLSIYEKIEKNKLNFLFSCLKKKLFFHSFKYFLP